MVSNTKPASVGPIMPPTAAIPMITPNILPKRSLPKYSCSMAPRSTMDPPKLGGKIKRKMKIIPGRRVKQKVSRPTPIIKNERNMIRLFS